MYVYIVILYNLSLRYRDNGIYSTYNSAYSPSVEVFFHALRTDTLADTFSEPSHETREIAYCMRFLHFRLTTLTVIRHILSQSVLHHSFLILVFVSSFHFILHSSFLRITSYSSIVTLSICNHISSLAHMYIVYCILYTHTIYRRGSCRRGGRGRRPRRRESHIHIRRRGLQ